MEATHLIKEKLIDGTAKRVAIKDVLIRQSDLADMLEEYHQAKLKLLGIADVVGRSEQYPNFKCDVCNRTLYQMKQNKCNWEPCPHQGIVYNSECKKRVL